MGAHSGRIAGSLMRPSREDSERAAGVRSGWWESMTDRLGVMTGEVVVGSPILGLAGTFERRVGIADTFWVRVWSWPMSWRANESTTVTARGGD